MNYKYDYLLGDKMAESFLTENSYEIFGKKAKIRILESKRADNYNQDSYNMWFKISVDEAQKEIRVSGQSYLNKKIDYSVMNFYYQNGFDSGNILVARPLAYLDQYNLFIYENISGITFLKEVEAGEKDITDKVRLSAEALKKIHQLSKPSFKLWDNTTLYKFEEYEKNAIGKFYPKFVGQIDKITGEIKNKIEQKTSNDFCHGDFQPNNLIFNNNKLYVIDFGTSCLLDREYDIASFICQFASMMRRYGEGIDFESLTELFMKTYGQFNQEKFNYFSALVNLRTLGVYCVFSQKMDNAKYIPLIFDLLRNNLTSIGYKIDGEK